MHETQAQNQAKAKLSMTAFEMADQETQPVLQQQQQQQHQQNRHVHQPYFIRHGHFCACHPMEVIAATITASVLLFSYAMSITQNSLLLSTTINSHDGLFITISSSVSYHM